MDDGAAAREFHLLTRHGAAVDRSRLVQFEPLDPTKRPRPFKRYVGRDPVPLPRDFAPSTARAVDVLAGRATATSASLDERALARLLFLTAGVTRVSTGPAFDEPTYFRTAMSAGNLHPVEVYVVSRAIGAITAGVHHFEPLEFGLVSLREGDHRGALAAAVSDETVASAPVSLVLTGVPWRTAWKYGERGYRHLWWDAGTMTANLLAASGSVGVDARVIGAFVDDAVATLVAVDGVTEFPLVVVPLGASVEPGAPPHPVAPLSVPTEPVSSSTIEFPLVTATHRAGALYDEADVQTWREHVRDALTPVESAHDTPAAAPNTTIDDVILQRGSTRLMRRDTAPRDLLLWALDVASRPVPGDGGNDGTLLEHEVSVHAIDGVAGGLYRLVEGRLDAVLLGDAREVATRLCLDQPLAGDAAYTVFHAASLDRVLRATGTRGYRAAQFEAGVVSGRLALAAFALGYGATGLTFYDDLVMRVFETDATPMLATAVGVPDYRNARGGARPGELTELTGYARLMRRLSAQLRSR